MFIFDYNEAQRIAAKYRGISVYQIMYWQLLGVDVDAELEKSMI